MVTKYEITVEQKAEIEQSRKVNRDKRTEAKLILVLNKIL